MEEKPLQLSGAKSAASETGPELCVEPSLESMPQVLGYLERQGVRLAIGGRKIRAVNSAGAQAFCAACLTAHKGLVSVELAMQQGILRLKVGFSGKGKARPYGLAPALFTPLGCRTVLEQVGYRWQWTASWEL